MAHTGNPFGGGAAGGGNPYGAGGPQPVQHRRDCREPYRNPCANPCGPDDDGDDLLDVVLDESGTGDGPGSWPGGGGGRGGRDARGDSGRGDGPFGGGQGGSSSGASDRGPSGDAPGGGSGGNSGGDKDGCGCMPGGKGGGGGGRNGDGCFGGGGGGGSRGGGGGGGDGCGGCDPCLLRIVLVLPFVVLWSALRALVGRPVRTAAHDKPLSQTDRVLPHGRAARTLFRAVRWYRLSLSPRKPEPICRYTPSCSTYAAQSLQRHGAWHGTRLTLRRLSRCNPGHEGGYDPVPQRGQ